MPHDCAPWMRNKARAAGAAEEHASLRRLGMEHPSVLTFARFRGHYAALEGAIFSTDQYQLLQLN